MAGSSRHRDAIALLGAVVLLVAPVWIVREISGSDNPVDAATRYGAYLGAAAIAVPLLVVLVQWWWRGRRTRAVPATAAQVMAAADQLAMNMLDNWRREAPERRNAGTPDQRSGAGPGPLAVGTGGRDAPTSTVDHHPGGRRRPASPARAEPCRPEPCRADP